MDGARPVAMRRTRIFEVLQDQGRTQRWLARRLGCSEAYLSRVKAGQRVVPYELAERASAILGLPLSVLFFDPILSEESEPLAVESDEEPARARVA